MRDAIACYHHSTRKMIVASTSEFRIAMLIVITKSFGQLISEPAGLNLLLCHLLSPAKLASLRSGENFLIEEIFYFGFSISRVSIDTFSHFFFLSNAINIMHDSKTEREYPILWIGLVWILI